METDKYLSQFNKAVAAMDQQLFRDAGLKFKVGVWLNSVVLKIQKPQWQHYEPYVKGIFFSIWASDDSIRAGRICYNIHALKLRELSRYKIQSRDFAAAFRTKFKAFEQDWPNVSVNFGPLTLMEGWVDHNDIETTIAALASKFITIQHMIDELLEHTIA